jgi:hypothetical protein
MGRSVKAGWARSTGVPAVNGPNVAVKVVHRFFASQPGFKELLQNEAMASAKLRPGGS